MQSELCFGKNKEQTTIPIILKQDINLMKFWFTEEPTPVAGKISWLMEMAKEHAAQGDKVSQRTSSGYRNVSLQTIGESVVSVWGDGNIYM